MIKTISLIGSVEASKLLGIDRKTLVNYVKKGRIPAQKLPTGFYRYDKEVILEIAKQWRTDVNDGR